MSPSRYIADPFILPEFKESVMEPPKLPAEIAREAIRRLTSRRLPPTPENFRQAYADVSGEEIPPEPHWPDVLRPLIRQWDAHQSGLTRSRKQEMLERVMINFGNDSRQLREKLAALARSWSEGVIDGEAGDAGGRKLEATAGQGQAGDPGEYRSLMRALADNLGLLADGCEPRWPELARRAADLSRAIGSTPRLETTHYETWSSLWRELLAHAEDDHDLSAGLKRLMGLLFLNIGELVGDEAWLSGQFAAMENLMAGDLQPEALLQAERGLRELAFKQGVLKGSLDEARSRLKTLITTFIDRVGEMSQSADGYQVRIGEYSEKIGQARDIAELGDLMGGLTADVGGLRDALRQNHGELLAARGQAEQAEQRIRALEQELAQVSSLVREDQLTGALNRRGMDEAFSRELARADRLGEPLSIGLLDIDHFKKLNDGLGHQAGDAALRHLARVVRNLLRPTDSLARYGGEEFLILLPNTDITEAERILQRIQRELTRQFFMHDNERVLITFSAGVAQRRDGEAEAALLSRADQAMYAAKSHGRNRVERG
jgi:diguanylate cyclase